jgi:hypothetical protein
MPKGARGEGFLEVDGERLAVLFTNRALVEAEGATGKSVLQFVNAMNNNALGMGDTVQLLAIGLEHARRDTKSRKAPYTVGDAYDVMDALGFTAVLPVVLSAIGDVLGYSPQKEVEEDAEGDEPAPPA